jgi:LmbE family N-acetylglucosaminyl deacetylase
MSNPTFDSDSRLLLVAAHPDDESLACAVALQRAVHAGAAVRVIYVTDGDNNPWPQRVIEWKWRLKAADRSRWGRIRRAEALAALRLLGVEPAAARFIGLPDQKLTELLIRDCRFVLKRLASMISQWGPTHLIFPSHFDRHPDHSAVAVMIQLILPELVLNGITTSAWTYAVHGNSCSFFGRAEPMQSSDQERLMKLQAIRCHATQLRLSRRRFLGYLSRAESFINCRALRAKMLDDSFIRSVTRQPDSLRLELRIPIGTRLLLAPTLLLAGRNNSGELCSARFQLPTRLGELRVPLFSSVQPIFLKLERRSLFFDQAGWVEIPAPRSEPESLSADCLEEPAMAVR